MKVKVYINDQMHWLEPTLKWQKLNLDEPIRLVNVDQDFYVATFKLTEITAQK